MNKLPFKESLIEGCNLGLKNFLPLLGASVLYILTIWIPYLNVGTTIAMQSIPAELGKGNIINPVFIFDSKYRKNMGEFFILVGLELMAFIPAFFLGIIPMFVLSYAWSLAILLFVDKGELALNALRKSSDLTYGYKWRIFGLSMVLAIAMCLLHAIFSGICGALDLPMLGTCCSLILTLLYMPFSFGLVAVIYRNLTNEAPAAEPAESEEVK